MIFDKTPIFAIQALGWELNSLIGHHMIIGKTLLSDELGMQTPITLTFSK